MKSLLIHGCYDALTLETLINLGAREFAFDLRPRSLNLVSQRDLTSLLNKIKDQRVFLVFENDRLETVISYLNLLKTNSVKCVPLFRDQQEPLFYEQLRRPFFWMFHPEADWRNILRISELKGVLLPVKFQKEYQLHSEFWKLIEANQLDIFVHADNFEETLGLNSSDEINLSVDLTKEVEESYRHIDQNIVRNLKIWRILNENSARQ